MTKKKGLGKGLAALIGEAEDPNLSKSEIKEINESKSNEIPIEFLFPNKNQPRKIFDEENLNELANSIRERGILQPIIVRKSNDDQLKFEIIAGERRWLAAQKAGLHDVPVAVSYTHLTLPTKA